MNGGLSATFFTFGAAGAAAYSVTSWERVFSALMASCLAHMLFMLLPSPEAGGAALLPATSGVQHARPGTLEVQLKEVGAPPPVPSAPVPAASRAVPRGTSRASRPLRGADLPAQAFRTADQLTKHPRPKAKPVFELPSPTFEPGKVILKVWIDAAGNVLAVDVEESSVPEPLSESAAAAFRRTPFVPGEIAGMRVATLMRIEVTYADGIYSYGMKNSAR
jgi:TonB family protein